jgi:hypothetical protein
VQALGPAVGVVVVGAVDEPVCVLAVDVVVELVWVEAGAVADDVVVCRLATPVELCDELPHAAGASVQARISAARILMCRCFGRGMSGSFPGVDIDSTCHHPSSR